MKGYEGGLAAYALYVTFVYISREEEALLSDLIVCDASITSWRDHP